MVSLGSGGRRARGQEADPLTNVAEPPGMARGAGAHSGPGGHDQVASATIQARAAQASCGEGSGAQPQALRVPTAGGQGRGCPTGACGLRTLGQPATSATAYLCGGCPRSGSGPQRTHTAPPGPGSLGPSGRPPPGVHSVSHQSIFLGGRLQSALRPLPSGRPLPHPSSQDLVCTPVPQSLPVKAMGQVQW